MLLLLAESGYFDKAEVERHLKTGRIQSHGTRIQKGYEIR